MKEAVIAEKIKKPANGFNVFFCNVSNCQRVYKMKKKLFIVQVSVKYFFQWYIARI